MSLLLASQKNTPVPKDSLFGNFFEGLRRFTIIDYQNIIFYKRNTKDNWTAQEVYNINKMPK